MISKKDIQSFTYFHTFLIAIAVLEWVSFYYDNVFSNIGSLLSAILVVFAFSYSLGLMAIAGLTLLEKYNVFNDKVAIKFVKAHIVDFNRDSVRRVVRHIVIALVVLAVCLMVFMDANVLFLLLVATAAMFYNASNRLIEVYGGAVYKTRKLITQQLSDHNIEASEVTSEYLIDITNRMLD